MRVTEISSSLTRLLRSSFSVVWTQTFYETANKGVGWNVINLHLRVAYRRLEDGSQEFMFPFLKCLSITRMECAGITFYVLEPNFTTTRDLIFSL